MTVVKSVFNSKDPKSIKLNFKQAIEKISNIFAKENVIVKPYLDSRLIHFSKLDFLKQIQINKDVWNYIATLESAIQNQKSIRDGRTSLWCAMRTYKLTPTSDIFDKIDNDDAIEIYDSLGIQI